MCFQACSYCIFVSPHASSYPGVPLVQGLDVNEGHFSVGTGHHAIVLTADDQINVFPKLPVTVPEIQKQAVSLRGSRLTDVTVN